MSDDSNLTKLLALDAEFERANKEGDHDAIVELMEEEDRLAKSLTVEEDCEYKALMVSGVLQCTTKEAHEFLERMCGDTVTQTEKIKAGEYFLEQCEIFSGEHPEAMKETFAKLRTNLNLIAEHYITTKKLSGIAPEFVQSAPHFKLQ